VAQSIRRALDEGPYSPSDIAILYRTNAQSRVLEEHLRAARVPAKVVGAVSFFERREVKDVIAYLRLLANLSADSAFERIVNVPARGLGETTVERLRAATRGPVLSAAPGGTPAPPGAIASMFEAARIAGVGAGGLFEAGAGRELAQLTSATRKKLRGFVELVDGLRDVIAGGASVAETIQQVIVRSGMLAKLEADDTSESRDRIGNLAELVTSASAFDQTSDEPQTVEAYLERVALSAPADEADSGEKVVLMTIHIAKGLEWPVVFLAGMNDGLFPSLREREGVDQDAALEEERRLAYVAITRARKQLVLTHSRVRSIWGQPQAQIPSRFLDDLPRDVLAAPVRPRVMTPKAPAIVDGTWSGVRRRPRAADPGAPALGARRKRRGTVDELDQRVPDDEPVYQLDDDLVAPVVFRTGDHVTHELLGMGRVVAITDGKVIVEFPGAGRKTVLPKFLELADSGDDGLN
jgi:DNA helicase-2/ATP-dependent DNA helicase PcrA